METKRLADLINFLQQELAIPATDLQFALRYSHQTPNFLPIILWQYGFVTLTQLECIFDWLDKSFGS
ncbi:MAG: DUF2949 domain-containing protein [Scytonematopsis contorta HA4267-MV1]|jgi:Protein of unknown function (DUF2949)|nr:DUF2949 domain-containing protein [Scytonematopsis contorta HA4267-MV1]